MAGMTSAHLAQPVSAAAADLVSSSNDQSSESNRLRKMLLFQLNVCNLDRMSAVSSTPDVTAVKERNSEHEPDSLGEQTVEVVRRTYARQPTVQTTTNAGSI